LDDLPDCLALAQDREWLPEERKWRLLFAVGSVYGVRGEAGDLAGAVVLTRYGTELAVIGMLLVAARYGRQGLGRALMTHVLAEAGDAAVCLNATDNGRPLYEKLGFVPVGMTRTHVGDFGPAAGHFGPAAGASGSRPATPGDLPAIRKLDAQANGVDRAYLVRRLPGFAEELRVLEHQGIITGCAAAWRNIDNAVIGPVIAASAADAQTLIADVAGAVAGPVRVDLDDRHPQLREWAAAHGLEPRASSAVMVHDGRPLPGDRARWFVPLMQALG
jgi:predicted N-acetyltransferase YhbS